MENKPKLNIVWKQEGNKVYFDYKGKEIYFIMPDKFDLSKVHPDIIKVCEYLMFSPWYNTLKGHTFSRKQGENKGISFSTGVDSTAAYLLYPESYLVYDEREGAGKTMLNQDNAINFINYLKEKENKKVDRVRTNFELIKTFHGSAVGYPTDMGMAVPLILMSDMYNLGYIVYGKVFCDQFFTNGTFRDYTSHFYERQNLLRSAGLEGLYPTVGCSEVITSKIVNDSKYKNLAFSCIRGDSGKQCNNCYKCYRKSLLKGVLISRNKETDYSINKNPPKMIIGLLYGLRKAKVRLPELEYLNNIKMDMFDSYFYPAYKLYDEDTRVDIFDRLREKGIKPMTEEETVYVKQLNFRRKEDN